MTAAGAQPVAAGSRARTLAMVNRCGQRQQGGRPLRARAPDPRAACMPEVSPSTDLAAPTSERVSPGLLRLVYLGLLVELLGLVALAVTWPAWWPW